MKSAIATVFYAVSFVVYCEAESISAKQIVLNKQMNGIKNPSSKYISASVSLRDADDIHFCLGVVYHPKYIITAARCVYQVSKLDDFGRMYVLAGANIAPISHQIGHVLKINFPDGYEDDESDLRAVKDIAIITLVTPFNNKIATMNAVLCDEVPVGTFVQAVTLTEDCAVIVQSYNITNTGLNIYATLITNNNEPINNDISAAGGALIFHGKLIGIRSMRNLSPRTRYSIFTAFSSNEEHERFIIDTLKRDEAEIKLV